MNKSKFVGLIIMMLLSIFGIIWVQIIWIRNAISIRNETFNHAVIVNLNNAAQTIESSRKMSFFDNFLFSDPLLFGNTTNSLSSYLSIESYSSGSGNNLSISIENQSAYGNSLTGEITTFNQSVSIFGDTSTVSDSVTLVVTEPDESRHLSIVKRGEEMSANSREVFLRQNEFLEWVKDRSQDLQNLSGQMISEIYRWEKTLELENKEIEYTLKQTLSFAGINTPFEYAIIKDGTVEDGTFKKSEKKDFLKSNYMVRLFPDNILRRDLVLSVVFPERTNYVLGSMLWLFGGSLSFSLFILATFALSLYLIIRQKKVSKMKSDFINNMTHEFKTPIATISLAADTISNPKIIKDEDRIRHFIGMIKKENSRMNKKVETILQIASLDKKEMDFSFENASIHTIIEHSIESIDLQIQQRDGKITVFLNAEEAIIYCDSEHLSNIVNNLLDNAIKYSPEPPKITVKTENCEKGILLYVEDEGVGMSKAVQSKIFERFYRQSSGNVHDVKGFGLGLNYTRAIIEAHKGTINVSSEPGKGSLFEIFLPFNWEN
jgi:two-component system, OmpR family, phosphate regulon sensor histidine kinase PhoR